MCYLLASYLYSRPLTADDVVGGCGVCLKRQRNVIQYISVHLRHESVSVVCVNARTVLSSAATDDSFLQVLKHHTIIDYQKIH